MEKPETETKKDVLMATAPKPSTPNGLASEKVYNTSKAAGDFTLQAFGPLDEALSDVEKPIHPTTPDSVERSTDLIKSRSAVLSPPSLYEGEDSPGLSDENSQYQDTSTTRPKDMVVHKSRMAVSSPHDSEIALLSYEFPRNSKSDFFPCDGGVTLPSGNAHGQLTPASDHLGTTPCVNVDLPGLHSNSKTRSRCSQPETSAPPRRSPRIQEMNAIKAEKQGLQQPHGPHPLTPDSAAFVSYHSSQSAFPSTPAPKLSVQVQNAFGDPDSPCPYHSVSLLLDPFTSTPDSPSRTSYIKGEGNLAGNSPLIKNEPDAGDDSHSGITLSAPCPGPYRRSQSTPLVPSSGSPDVVWKWSFTKNRKRMLPKFLWTVQTMCKDLTKIEIPKGYIYAFSVDDPQMNNYVKIGVSGDLNTLKVRAKRHTACYGQLRHIYPLLGQEFIPVDHAHRVEHLVHAELVQHALEIEQCPNPRGSHGAHGEWFDVEYSHAIAVIEKWTHWMSSSPYKEGPPC